jgi:hypothetical protein
VRVLLDALDHFTAVVFNGRLDALAVNALGRGALDAGVTACQDGPTVPASCSSTSRWPAGFQNSATGADLRLQAAGSYSLISPPRTDRRLVR